MMTLLQFAPLVAERVLNAIPGGLLIAVLAWLLLRVIGRQNSGTRFAVWFFALLAVVALPLIPALTSHMTPSLMKRFGTAQSVPPEITLPESWALGIFAAWMLIATLAIVRIAVGLWNLRQLRKKTLPVVLSNLPRPIQDVVSQFQSTRQVEVRNSSAVTVPTAIGFFKPAILLPEWTLLELSADELKVILLHEFAHLQRWDDWTNLAQKLVRTVFFFHPAVWWIEKRLSLEREMACDEAVLAKTENPQAYAECLVSLAEKSFVRRGLALAQAVIGRAKDTSLRLAHILDGNRPTSSRIFKPALGLVTVLGVCSFILLPGAPRFIAFETASVPAAASRASTGGSAQSPVTPVTPVVQAFDPNHGGHTGHGGPPQLPQALVVPALMRTTASRDAAAHKKSPSMSRDSLTVARNATPKRIEPIPTLVRATTQQDAAAPEMWFVMQTAQYNENGTAILQLSVWRVTVDNQNRQTVQQEVFVRLL